MKSLRHRGILLVFYLAASYMRRNFHDVTLCQAGCTEQPIEVLTIHSPRCPPAGLHRSQKMSASCSHAVLVQAQVWVSEAPREGVLTPAQSCPAGARAPEGPRAACCCAPCLLLGSPLSLSCQGTARYSPAGVGSAGTAFLAPPTENISPQAAALRRDSEALSGDAQINQTS